MRTEYDVFHLAIPVYDLDATVQFYVATLGCKLARRYDDRVTLDFFGDQLVCHLTPAPERLETVQELKLYPRHFGVTFRDRVGFDAVLDLCRARHVPIHSEMSTRFEGMVEAHSTFVICDPANNLIEFKHYADPRMMY